MPIYTCRCENCGVQFDRHQSFDDDPLTVCPECQHESLHKVYLPVGIVFKGKGFYTTDHRSSTRQGASHNAQPKDKEADSGSDSVETKETETKAESKSKTETKAAKKED